MKLTPGRHYEVRRKDYSALDNVFFIGLTVLSLIHGVIAIFDHSTYHAALACLFLLMRDAS